MTVLLKYKSALTKCHLIKRVPVRPKNSFYIGVVFEYLLIDLGVRFRDRPGFSRAGLRVKNSEIRVLPGSGFHFKIFQLLGPGTRPKHLKITL